MTKKPVHSALGATHPVGSEQVTLFIPSKDQLGQPIDQDYWTVEALGTLGRLFRGATAFPPGKGVWRDDTKGRILLHEVTVMVVSYANKTDLQKNLHELRTFLHRFGREANQGEVGLIISGDYYGISEYDKG
jgi:hypothetical protein